MRSRPWMLVFCTCASVATATATSAARADDAAPRGPSPAATPLVSGARTTRSPAAVTTGVVLTILGGLSLVAVPVAAVATSLPNTDDNVAAPAAAITGSVLGLGVGIPLIVWGSQEQPLAPSPPTPIRYRSAPDPVTLERDAPTSSVEERTREEPVEPLPRSPTRSRGARDPGTPERGVPTQMRSPGGVGGGIALGLVGLGVGASGFGVLATTDDAQAAGVAITALGLASVAGGTALIVWGAQQDPIPSSPSTSRATASPVTRLRVRPVAVDLVVEF